MLLYSDLISRADTAWLQQFIADDVVHVINALDPHGPRAASIRHLFFTLQDPYKALSTPSIRKSLFELLRPAEAQQLALALGLSGEPFETLERTPINKYTERFNTCCAYFGLPVEQRTQPEPPPTTQRISANYSLFPHQQQAVHETIEALSARRKRVVLHMPTGAGKTRMAMHTICRHLTINPSALVVWLANSEELCEQACDEFSIAWNQIGDRTVNLYRYWGSRNIEMSALEGGLLIGGFAKLYSLAKAAPPKIAELGDRTSLLVVDEAHQAIAPTYQLVINGISARKINLPILGLTATPGRTWNNPETDQQLADFFDRQKVTLKIPGHADPVDFLVDEGFLAHPTFRELKHESELLTGPELKGLADDLDVPAAVLKKLAADEIRTVRIIREIESLTATHQRIIVFATTVGHALTISAILSARGISAKCVTGSTDGSARSAAIEWFKEPEDDNRILVNFGVLTTGFDAPRTSCALIARPTKSLVLYSQMVGRAIRGPRAGGNKYAEIVTVVDTALPGFGDLARAFTNWEDVW